MTKQTLLLLAALLLTSLLFSGCAERGYKLTSQASTNTITAQTSTNIADTKAQIKSKLQKMQDAVKKEHKNKASVSTKKRAQDTITEIKATKKAARTAKRLQENILKAEALKREALLRQAEILKKQILQESAIEEKKLQEKLLENKKSEEAQAKKIKQLAVLKAKNKADEAKVLEAQIAKERLARQKQKNEEQKALASKKALEEKNAEVLRKAQVAEQKVLEEERLTKDKQLKAQREQKIKLDNAKKASAVASSTEELNFKLINKIYHKFGTSEVHGHVIYLDPAGQETTLGQSKVYLLPISAKLNHWFNNYYLKNTNNPSSNGTLANYLNSTYLDLSKNFEFYGVAEGSYYIIIESNYPSSMAKDKKVYIAKKIKVGKHKKIMAVFSKKL